MGLTQQRDEKLHSYVGTILYPFLPISGVPVLS